MSAVQATGAEIHNAASAAGTPEAELAHKCLYYMVLMREVEDRIERKLYRQGKILGGVYVGRGQEAIPVGSALVVPAGRRRSVPSHRDMAVFFIRGVSARRVFAQYMGRMGGLTRGRDGNMHMGDMSVGVVSPSSAPWRPLCRWPPALALALKYKGSPTVAFCYFGDGATSRGDWHEGVNFASVQKLPLVLICNNNQYAYSTPLNKQMACANVADRGPGVRHPRRNRGWQRRAGGARSRRSAPRPRARRASDPT